MEGTKLHIGSLAPAVTQEMLFEKFSKIGHLIAVTVDNHDSNKHAIVHFVQHEDAERAMKKFNNAILRGRPMRIRMAEPDPAPRRFKNANIFIKNLPAIFDNNDLYDIFSTFGEILSFKVAKDKCGKSRGHGFVQFSSEESGLLAIQQLNGKIVGGKELFVAKHKQNEERLKEKEQNFTNVFVKNFGDELDDDGLKEIFEEYGKITSCKVELNDEGYSKGFGFVSFESSDNAKKAVKALNEKELICSDGSTVTLNVARHQTKAERAEALKHSSQQNMKEGVNLYVKNLDESVNDVRLKRMFSRFGIITSAKVMVDDNGKSKCFGFVSFSCLEEAADAIKAMHGEIVASKTLYVSFAQSKEERRADLALKHSQHTQQRRPPSVQMQRQPLGPSYDIRQPMAQMHLNPYRNFVRPNPAPPVNVNLARGINLYAGNATHLRSSENSMSLLGKTGLAHKTQQRNKTAGTKKAPETRRKYREPVENSYTPTEVRKSTKHKP